MTILFTETVLEMKLCAIPFNIITNPYICGFLKMFTQYLQ